MRSRRQAEVACPAIGPRVSRRGVNETLRRGLARPSPAAPREPFKVEARDLGRLRADLNLDNIAGLIEQVEGLWAFLRIATNPRVFEHPLSIAEAERAVSSWLAQAVAGILEPGERHWEILRELIRSGQTAGPLVVDAALAAIAIEHGATLCTTDRDFARFPGLAWMNPLLNEPSPSSRQ
jgi:toxin-antitoxin system PIN domain toxin